MVMRKIVVVGDRTTTNGMILPNANSTFSIGGHKAALIGGPVYCPACKSIGSIAKAGGPRRVNFMGEVAQEADIVICGCSERPKLVANVGQTTTNDDLVESHGVLPHPDVLSDFDQQFHLINEVTGNPIAGQRFRITWPGGVFEGISDADGLTPRVVWHEPASIKIELVD
jgi:uncharacterized Zn-binding protein involved in type VI secretion